MTGNVSNSRALGLFEALDLATARVRIDGEEGDGPLSARGLFATALRALVLRERGGAAAASARLIEFHRLLADIALDVRAGASRATAPEAALPDIEVASGETFADWEARLADGQALAPAQLRALCEWEADDLLRPLTSGRDAGGTDAAVVDADLLTGYLQRRLGDPELRVIECRQLSGGFGKETHVFTIDSVKLSGEFVMRRDMPIQLIPNACHRVGAEFALIKAVGEAGFETPNVLWVDTNHPDIPGGDFIIMARSPGQAGGSLFGADATPDPALNDKLGVSLAALHGLPPLLQLGDLTESIRVDLWNRPAHEAVRAYLENYLGMLRAEAHTHSPATAAVFRWLLQNIPESEVQSCLVHGDIGFHNMLLEKGELVAVLDWEFAHIGHPAEDLAYAYNAAGQDLDWPRVIRAYEAAGGAVIPHQHFEYYRILMQARNAVSTNLASAKLFQGAVTDLRLLSGDFYFRPHILKSLGQMIADFQAHRSH